MEKYEVVRKLGSGAFGTAILMMNKHSNDLVAVKFLPRGNMIDERVVREIINHRSLHHPNIVRFKEVALIFTHLAIVMEHAAGGELFDRVVSKGRFCEHEARYFFQQIITGVSYCHDMHICHRDLKLENIILDGSSACRIKICDFGHSKSYAIHSRPNSRVGSPNYTAPEVFYQREYDGKLIDVWSCGMILYIMLTGQLPFEDPHDPTNIAKTVKRTMALQCNKIPDDVHISQDCLHILSRIFVVDPLRRITIKEIKSHPWFLEKLELTEVAQGVYYEKENTTFSLQSIEDITNIVMEAQIKL